jgi:UDP-4-amino-4,6-dideoxy-N-acetyl-beta-L-altrosamine N-acetyltransferase
MLKSNNITLRPLKFSDWEKTIKWRNDYEIKQLAMMHPYPITEFIEKEWYEELLKNKSNKVIYFAIADKDDSPLGYIFLNNINPVHRNCFLGIVIGDKKQRGKGYGTEAVELLAQYAFNTLNMHKITVEVININPHAIKVYEKLGFVNEGCMKQQFFSDGKYYDVLIMSLFKK